MWVNPILLNSLSLRGLGSLMNWLGQHQDFLSARVRIEG